MVTELMKEIINNSPVVVFLWEAKTGWKIQYVSENVIQFGYKPEELITGSILYTDLIYPEDRKRAIDEVERYTALKLDHYSQEYRIITKSGEIKWVDDRTTIRRDENNKIIYHQGVVIDITDRKNMEEILQKTNDQLNVIIQSSPLAIYDLRLNGYVKSIWNPAAERIFGWKKAEVINHYLPIVSADKKQEFESNIQRVLNREIVSDLEVIRIRKDGSNIPISVSTSLLHDSKNDITGILAMATDISDRKKADDLKNEFINTITHELRTPLTSIRESVNLLGMLNPDKENPEHKFIMETSQRNITRLSKLINDILDIQKMEFGAMVYHFENHQINDLARQVVDELITTVHAKDLKINVDLSDQVPDISFDWDRIEDVLFNLISNAIKFTDKGQISIHSSISNNNEILLTVSDTGIGISKEDLPKLFNKFQQLSKDYNRSKGGSGLGLVIAKKIVEAHHGKIEVESEPGKGSTFRIYLPNHKN